MVKGRLVKQPYDRIEPLYPTARLVKQGVLQSERILEQARQALQQAQAEAQQIRAQAETDVEKVRQTGIDQARQAAAVEFAKRLQRVDDQVQQLRGQFAQEVQRVALRLARQILDVEFQVRPERIVDLVGRVLSHARQHKQISVHLHPDYLQTVSAQEKQLLEPLPLATSIGFVCDPELPMTGVRIETEMGVYDGSIDTQMQRLSEHLLGSAGWAVAQPTHGQARSDGAGRKCKSPDPTAKKRTEKPKPDDTGPK